MTSSDNLPGGPHIAAAMLCDRVLQEKDGVLSLIRMVDRFVRPRPTPQIPPQPIQVNLVISLKAGGVTTGSYKIKLRVFKPNTTAPAAEMEPEAFFEGGEDRGVNIVVPFLMLAEEDGVYWIDVLFENQLLTKIPFRVILVANPTQPSKPQPGA
jgi:hypothetical protein